MIIKVLDEMDDGPVIEGLEGIPLEVEKCVSRLTWRTDKKSNKQW